MFKVYYEFWNRIDREWQVGRMNIVKFIIIRLYNIFFELYDISDFKYLPKSRIIEE